MNAPEKFYTYTLSNGLRIILQPTEGQVSYAGFAINAGTRDERADQPGMAHFVEHMLFKGTEKRKAWHILNRMEKVGADLDAYTNKEETVVYSVFLQEHLKRAVDLMADLVFHSTFPQAEIEKETDVIIGEIQSYEDTPSDLIFDGFEDLIFSGHALGRDILGSADALKRYTTADALAFYRQFYVPENMVFFVTGRYEMKQVIRYVEKAVEEIPQTPLDYVRLSPSSYVAREQVQHRDTHQAHVMMGNRAYEGNSKKKLMLYLLTNLLGGTGMNSRLNVALREKRGLVYEVEANSTSYTDTGTFSIYFGCDLEDVDRCVALTRRELKKLCEKALTISQLQALKKQTMGQIGVAQDNRENNALGMAKTFLHYDRFVTTEEVYKSMDRLTPVHLLEVANEVFGEQNLSTLIYR
ncbi:MAG: insulinase family protein [Bacteroidaceae bacterium]|nr:insulinase family protein [Bacteroidaceae bacterium]MBQ9500438.1 insulinase family protein [Bacteroidaceae bacterium]